MSNDIRIEDIQGFRVVHVGGEVDLSWSSELRDAVLRSLGEHGQVLVDLSAVTYIDSSGIAALVEGLQNARSDGKSFALVNTSPPALAVLELARLDQVFELHPDFDAAVASRA